MVLLTSCKKDNPAPETPQPGFTKKVLLEKFTTTSCGNCGKADLDIERYKKLFPGRLVSVHFHVSTGLFGGDSMATTDGEHIATTFGLQGTPSAAINRTPDAAGSNSLLYLGNNWLAPISNDTKETADCGITLDAATISGNMLTIITSVKFSRTFTEPLYLSVYLTEDSVTGDSGYWQANYYNQDANVPELFGRGHPIKNYVHNDVYRVAATPFWGEEIPASKTKKDEIFTLPLTVDISNYRTQHLKVVAFVHGKGDMANRHKYRVLNAQEVHAGKTQGW